MDKREDQQPLSTTEQPTTEPITTIGVPSSLQNQYVLNCSQNETFDPVKLVELYLNQQKYEAFETLLQEKQTSLNSKFYPDSSTVIQPFQRRRAVNPRIKGRRSRQKARYIISDIKKAKTVFCHRSQDEDSYGRLIRNRSDI